MSSDSIINNFNKEKNFSLPTQPVKLSSNPKVKTECNLGPRELEILKLVALDLSDKEIAAALNISVRTVNNYLLFIYAKLGVKRRAGAVSVAFARGFLHLETVLNLQNDT